ncbi:FecCD family ABC transporter permease [Maridesulfovibrio bastinii]|uniref:FecCD family ABC transporter permease n=1 Tax=Maridesulfovibrio bastinii TaxID=47157 RepID=UPI00040FD940|nr:iron ABC transporter permease [Maridesulfovibrio bastinii]
MRNYGNRVEAAAVGLLIAGTCFSLVAACFFGPYDISVIQVLNVLADQLGFVNSTRIDSAVRFVVIDLRFGRICLAFLCGSSLSMAGVVYQGVLRNPLADPFTLGVSSGAAFGASLAIFLGSIPLLSFLWNCLGSLFLPLAALAGALVALTAVLSLGSIGGRISRETIVLAGIIVSTFLAALISLLKSLDEDSVSSIVFWIMGSFQGRGWEHVYLLLPYAAVGFLLVFFYSRELDILSLGDNEACHLGVNVTRSRLVLLLGASLVTGAAVAVSGVIGFIGLVVPHLVRMLFGSRHRPLLILSSLLGGLLLVWSDVLARTILSGGEELPVGVVTAMLGGPFFCLILRAYKKVHL